MTSALEDTFAFQLDALGLTGYVREYPAIPGRKFRYDFAFVESRLLVEVNGGGSVVCRLLESEIIPKPKQVPLFMEVTQ